jgi:predicted outer membrane lipoprotein
MKTSKMGQWAFILGLVVAIAGGIIGAMYATEITYILLLLGVIVGLLNITEKEVTSFLLAVVALLLVGGAGLENIAYIGSTIGAILANISAFVAPAAVIVALKAVYQLGKKK